MRAFCLFYLVFVCLFNSNLTSNPPSATPPLPELKVEAQPKINQEEPGLQKLALPQYLIPVIGTVLLASSMVANVFQYKRNNYLTQEKAWLNFDKFKLTLQVNPFTEFKEIEPQCEVSSEALKTLCENTTINKSLPANSPLPSNKPLPSEIKLPTYFFQFFTGQTFSDILGLSGWLFYENSPKFTTNECPRLMPTAVLENRLAFYKAISEMKIEEILTPLKYKLKIQLAGELVKILEAVSTAQSTATERNPHTSSVIDLGRAEIIHESEDKLVVTLNFKAYKPESSENVLGRINSRINDYLKTIKNIEYHEKRLKEIIIDKKKLSHIC